MKKRIEKLKMLAPALSVVVVLGCAVVSLNGYEAPVYAAETTDEGKEHMKDKEQTAEDKGKVEKESFDLEDGVYQGTGTGFAGEVTVAVQIKDKQIVAIDIVSTSDDEAFFNRALSVIDKIIAQQSLEVDVVSGATYSSNGIINAVKNALTGEKDSGETGASSAGTPAAGAAVAVESVEDAAAYKDGTYMGSGNGFGGTLHVEVVIRDGEISSIQILDHNEGSSYLQKASALIGSMISSQSTNVDTVSGATYSSVGIIQAVRDALRQAAITPTTVSGSMPTNDSSSHVAETEVTGTIPYVEGIYYGTAEGYLGDITVAVVIQNQTIKAILVTETSDDEAFFQRAMDVIKDVVKKQSTEVDTVSGATYSSKGLLDAVKNALLEAEKMTNGEKDSTENDSASDNITTENTNDEQGENITTVYKNGTYVGSAICIPDEDEDFREYSLSLEITIQNDRIISVSNVKGDGDSENDSYIKRAANGTTSIPGVIAQIVGQGTIEGVDAVSRATCTSKAIVEACNNALVQAAE